MLNRTFCVVAFLILIQPVYAQKTKFKTGSATPKNYYTEIEYEDVNGKIIIPVSINNSTYQFLFDTGAPNVISSEIYDTLMIEKSKDISVTDANNNKQNMRQVLIPALKMGGVSFRNTTALVFESNNNLVFDCFEIDGIIGTNLLRKSIVQIKSKEQVIVITNQNKKIDLNSENAVDMQLRGGQSSPYISIDLIGTNKGTERLLIDTGASGFYDLCKKNYTILKEKNVLIELANASGASSLGMFGADEASMQYRVQVPQMKIANTSLTNIVTTTGNDDNSRLGSDILKYGNITLDFRKKLFYYDSFEAENDLDEKLFGFTPTVSDNKVVVGLVWDDDLKESMKFGDEILKVNDTDLENLKLCDVLTMSSPFKNTDTLNLVLKNEANEIIELELLRIKPEKKDNE